MNRIILPLLFLAAALPASAQRLIVRGDDIGSFHAAGEAVIECYTDGIERSAELMVVTPWLPEAVRLLEEHEGLDAGLHLVLTSEWDAMKWRPLTACSSLCDENGYFLPMVFPHADYPSLSLVERRDSLDLGEIERELRAQIELGLRLLPRITHLTAHMTWHAVSPEIATLVERLSEEYGLPFMDSGAEEKYGIERLKLDYTGYPLPIEGRERLFLDAMEKMKRGHTYLFLDHPSYDTGEMRAAGHSGYRNVAADRQAVRDLFTSPAVKEYIERHGIELIGYDAVIGRQGPIVDK